MRNFPRLLIVIGLILLGGLYVTNAYAQSHTVKGTVLDALSGKPLPGATLGIEGTQTGTVADGQGQFSLSLSEGQILVIRALGYEPQKVPYAGQSQWDIRLTAQSTALDQVVVVGYGTQKKSSLTASVASIAAKDVQKQLSGNVASALQGQAPGVEVVQQGGIAGADVNILIRGAGSFGATEPLVVIDGAFSTTGLSALNPNDIQSIEVLKDGAAAAIYGSRAANGVVLITTKKGNKGLPVISLNMNYAFQKPTRQPDYLNASQWRNFANLVADNSGIAHAPEDDHPTDPSRNTNWQDLWFQYAPIYNANVDISGGGDHTRYFTSLGYYDQTGMVISSSFKKYNFRVNSTYEKNKLKISEDLAVTYRQKTPTPTISIPLPTLPVYDDNGHFVSGGPEYYIEGNKNKRSNPLAGPHYQDAYTHNTELLGNIQLSYDIIPGLQYRLNLAGSLNNSHDYTHTPQYYTRNFPNGEPDPDYGNAVNSLEETRGNEFQYNIDNLLQYTRAFGKHEVDALIGTSWLKENYRYETIGTTTDLGGTNITGVSGDGQISAAESNSALFSVFSRVNYNYDTRYLLSLSLRRDASSKFYKDSRVGYFPSLSAGWNLNEEKFFHSQTISRLKIRGSYGELGANFIDPYGFNSLAYGPIPAAFGVDQQRQSGRIVYLADQSLKWETAVSRDAGLEIGLFKDAFTFSVDYFIKTNRDLLARLSLPPSSGQTIVINEGFQPYVNAASVQNKGFDFLATYRKSWSQNLQLNVSLNLSTYRNKVLGLGDNVQPIRGELISGSFNDRPTITEKGLPIGSFIGYRILGIDDEGDFIFQDNNGLNEKGELTGKPDGKIDENDKVILGNPLPDVTYGFHTQINYKNFDLSLFIQGVAGNQIFNQTRYNNYFEFDNNVVTDALNAWTPEHTRTNIPRLTIADFYGGNSLPSSFYIENGSYMRLKNVQIGYSFNPGFLSRLKLMSLRLYAGAQNLLTFTSYSGYDPEVSSDVLFNRGVDFNNYPNAITVTFGVSASF